MSARGLGLLAAALGACSVPSLSVDGKQCPCADGYECDVTGGRCVPLGGAIEVAALEVAWTTPNQIRWTWDASGVPDQLREYQLVVAESEADLESRSGTSTVWTARQNPELGTFLLPRAEVAERTAFTTTDLHRPETEYFAQLIAIDTSGRASVSNVRSAQTTDPPISTIPIFEDEAPPGYSLPDARMFGPSASAPLTGDSCYLYSSPVGCPASCAPCCDDGTGPGCPCAEACNPCCGPGDTACPENLRFNELGLSLDDIPPGPFERVAFLEFAIASDATVPSYWAEAYLWFGDDTTFDGIWSMHPLTFRNDDEYRLIQIPLRVLAHYAADGDEEIVAETMPHSQLAARPLFGFGMGGTWTVGANVRIDDVHIRY